MFAKTIRYRDLNFLGEIAERAFCKITGDSYREDYSFVATLRALLLKRMGDNQTLEISINDFRYSNANYEDNSVAAILDASIGRPASWNDHLYICNLDCSIDTATMWFNKLSNASTGIITIAEDFTEVQDLENFLGNPMGRIRVSRDEPNESPITDVPSIPCRIFYSESKRCTFIFVHDINIRKFHYLQVFSNRYFPWYFKDNPVSEEELDLLKSLTRRRSDRYIEIIEEMASQYDLHELTVKSILGDFERESIMCRVRGIDSSIERINRNIEENIRHYQELIERLDNQRIMAAGLRAKLESQNEESELMDFFMRNKNLDPVDTSEQSFSFIVKTYLTNFDPDMFERYANNNRSHVWDNRNYSSDFDDVAVRRKLMNAIFSDDPKIKIRMCAFIRIDMRGSVESIRHYDYGRNYKNYIPNPHLDYHNCFGNNRPLIEEPLLNGDVIGALMQCISCAGSVNVAEGVSFGPFLDILFTSRDRILELPDGTAVTNIEALKWLYDQEAAENGDASTEIAGSEAQANQGENETNHEEA